MAEVATKSFPQALQIVLERLSKAENEEDRLISPKPMKIKFTKDFKNAKGEILCAVGSEQMVSELTMLAYKDYMI